jgi:hypothetical protein
MTFSVDVSGPAVYGVGADSINPNFEFSINVTETYVQGYGDWNRHTWVSPFVFTGTGLSSITWGDAAQFVPSSFSYLWDIAYYQIYESWGDGLPDLIALEGYAGCRGVPGSTMTFLSAKGKVSLLDYNSGGSICIDSGDAMDARYDWLFDDPIPSFAAPTAGR